MDRLFKIPWKKVLYFILLKKAYVLVIPHTFMHIKKYKKYVTIKK